jgi:putative transposase
MGLRNRSQLKHKRCFFVTTTCNQWLHIFDSPPFFELISDSLNFVADKYNAEILGYVIMREAAPPNHLHLIVIFNDEENQLSNLMRDFNRTGDQEVYFDSYSSITSRSR